MTLSDTFVDLHFAKKNQWSSSKFDLIFSSYGLSAICTINLKLEVIWTIDLRSIGHRWPTFSFGVHNTFPKLPTQSSTIIPTYWWPICAQIQTNWLGHWLLVVSDLHWLMELPATSDDPWPLAHRRSMIPENYWKHFLWCGNYDDVAWHVDTDVAWHVDVDMAWHVITLFSPLAIDNLRCHFPEFQHFSKLVDPRSIGHRRSQMSLGQISTLCQNRWSPIHWLSTILDVT